MPITPISNAPLVIKKVESATTIQVSPAGGSGGAVVTTTANGAAPAMGVTSSAVMVNDGGSNPVWRQLSMDDILPSFAASLTGGSTVEVGDSVVSPALTASYTGGPPVTAVLTDTEAHAAINLSTPFTAVTSPHTFTKTVPGATATFTLTATKGAVVRTPTTAIAWYARLFWGVAAAGGTSEAFIEGLASSALAASRARTLSVSPSSNRVYFALPTTFGTPTFTVGGFAGGFTLVATTSVTNAFGVTLSYNLWCSENDLTGSISVGVT